MKTTLTDEIKFLLDIEKGYNPALEHFFLELKTYLLGAWKDNLQEAVEELNLLNLSDPKEIEETFRNKLSNEFTLETEKGVLDAIKNVYKYTKKDFLSRFIIQKATYAGYSLREIDYEAIEYLKNHTNFWIKNYYDRFAGQDITMLIREGLQEELSTRQLGNVLQDYFMSGGLKQIPNNMNPDLYFEGLSRNTISRARMSGAVASLVQAEITEYEILVTEDERTCPTCLMMNGRVFSTQTAVEYVDTFNSLTTPEQVTSKLPWIKSPKEVMQPTSKLDLSMSLPPFHFLCRCDIAERSYTTQEEIDMMYNDLVFQKRFTRDALPAQYTRSWRPKTRAEAEAFVRIARKMDIPKSLTDDLTALASWGDTKATAAAFNVNSVGLTSLEDYISASVTSAKTGKTFAVISDQGFPEIWRVNRIKGKTCLTRMEIRGSKVTYFDYIPDAIEQIAKRKGLIVAYKVF